MPDDLWTVICARVLADVCGNGNLCGCGLEYSRLGSV